MEKKNFEIEKNPEAIALEYATNRIRKLQARERWYRMAVLLLSVVLLMMCVAWSVDEDNCATSCGEETNVVGMAAHYYSETEPKINLLLRERTMKRGVY